MYDPRAECLERPALEAVQAERLRGLLERLQRVPFYRERLAGAPAHAPLTELPFTTRSDLR
ncbi:MAG TPA: phenylacetate--CoA ligase, partial [Symbiobacteriaceae bacterium]|nr:phenylacetate--CoA ligase [Symbiobacteriaceae bacterium]